MTSLHLQAGCVWHGGKRVVNTTVRVRGTHSLLSAVASSAVAETVVVTAAGRLGDAGRRTVHLGDGVGSARGLVASAL